MGIETGRLLVNVVGCLDSIPDCVMEEPRSIRRCASIFYCLSCSGDFKGNARLDVRPGPGTAGLSLHIREALSGLLCDLLPGFNSNLMHQTCISASSFPSLCLLLA